MSFRIHLAKERFKFSVAHFTIFSESESEPLHGHNYHLSLDIEFKDLDPETGLTAKFSDLKSLIEDICESMDEKFLIPSLSPFIEVAETETNIEYKFNQKFYSLPKEDCLMLEIVNTSSECLAQWIHSQLIDAFTEQGARSLEVCLQESSGQSVTYKQNTISESIISSI